MTLLSWEEEYFIFNFQQTPPKPSQDIWSDYKNTSAYLKDMCSLGGMLKVKPYLQKHNRKSLLDQKINKIKLNLTEIFKKLPKERQNQAFIMYSSEKNKK